METEELPKIKTGKVILCATFGNIKIESKQFDIPIRPLTLEEMFDKIPIDVKEHIYKSLRMFLTQEFLITKMDKVIGINEPTLC